MAELTPEFDPVNATRILHDSMSAGSKPHGGSEGMFAKIQQHMDTLAKLPKAHVASAWHEGLGGVQKFPNKAAYLDAIRKKIAGRAGAYDRAGIGGASDKGTLTNPGAELVQRLEAKKAPKSPMAFGRECAILFARGDYDTVDESLWVECQAVVPRSKPFRVPFVLGKIDGNDVCAADFDIYKIKYDMDTVEGANDLETDWPRKEFGEHYLLVDINLALHEWAWVLYHEAHERQLMQDHGLTYDQAHVHANACEKQLRMRATERAAVPAQYARNEQAVAFFARRCSRTLR